MGYSLNDLGYMTDPDFHDGHLDGIRTSGSQVGLALRHLSGHAFSMVLTGVETFRADEFLLGNIVLNIRLTSGTRVAPEALSTLYPAPHPSADARFQTQYEHFLDGIITRIETRDVLFFTLSSSYGCDICAICKGVEILPINRDEGRRGT